MGRRMPSWANAESSLEWILILFFESSCGGVRSCSSAGQFAATGNEILVTDWSVAQKALENFPCACSVPMLCGER